MRGVFIGIDCAPHPPRIAPNAEGLDKHIASIGQLTDNIEGRVDKVWQTGRRL